METKDCNTQSGERLSFFQLFSEKNYQIEIPIIQRDYAQGRQTTEEVRETFLDALFQYLKEAKPHRDLDFVYGSISTDDNKVSKFIPLDGQQRLTTLFLLHWYLAHLSKQIVDFRKTIAIKDADGFKSKFTYETRTSSREFCDALVSNDFDLKYLLQAYKDEQNSLSKTILDSGWFYLSWQSDPTIQSMLTMLDSIHQKFSDNPEYYDLLVATDNPVITFLFLNLKEFKLTDDLYIKMNARGKPLTTFENFKAKFEQFIEDQKWTDTDKRNLLFDGVPKEVEPKEYFAHKIDTDWANLLWHYRNIVNKDNTYDSELMNFIRTIVSNEYASVCHPEKNSNLEFLIGTKKARDKKSYTDDISFHLFEQLDCLNPASITYLIEALDVLSNGDQTIHLHLADSFYYDETAIFEAVLKHDLTQSQRIHFHAYIQFLIKNKDDKTGFYQWMRVVHNLVENTEIDSAEDVAKAIKSLNTLLPFSNEIVDYLEREQPKIDFFYSLQVEEEIIKASLINKSVQWQSKIETAEHHNYFKGQIGFLMDFSGILKYFRENGNCTWDEGQNLNFQSKFLDYHLKACTVFTESGLVALKDHLWHRALLTKGDYLIKKNSNYSFLINSDRDISWKRLLRSDNEGKRKFVKDVFEDNSFSIQDLTSSLNSIINNSTVSDWRKHFIQIPEVLSYLGTKKFARWGERDEIFLLKKERLSGEHAEYYTFAFYTKHLTGNSFPPFKHISYFLPSGIDYAPCAFIDGWSFAGAGYVIDIHYLHFDKKFDLRFFKRYGNTINPDIESVLLKNGLSKSYKYGNISYCVAQPDETSMIEFLKQICSALNTL